jgi:hypothetical protein
MTALLQLCCPHEHQRRAATPCRTLTSATPVARVVSSFVSRVVFAYILPKITNTSTQTHLEPFKLHFD